MRPGKGLIAVLLALLIAQGVFSGTTVMPRYAKEFMPKSASSGPGGLNPELLFLQLFGFREFLAGILWVRADTYFDSGDYDSILPIVRMATWLDPHFIDVYSTGMWHLGYNFTDEDGRSDRRYIPYALALGVEGAENNPNTYEMYFETGWMWFHKVDDDYGQAVDWFDKANQREDILPARKNLFAVALQRAGKLDESLKWYAELYTEAEKSWRQNTDYQARTNKDTLSGNLDNQLIRMAERGNFARMRNDGTYEQLPYDTKPAFDVGFSASVTVEESRVLRIQGTWNVQPVGTRIRFVLHDADYPHAKPAGMEWGYARNVSLDPPVGLTWVQDGLFVKHRQFNRKIDMSRDPTMYPCSKPDYVIEFFYDPRSAPAHIQDKFGWDGEGMTDKSFVSDEIRPGHRVLYCTMKISRDQLLRQGEWFDKTPVIKTPNYIPVKSAASSQGEVIVVPGMRAKEPAPVNKQILPSESFKGRG